MLFRSWQAVDVTAVGQSTVSITSDNNGDIILVTFEGNIFRYNGTTWTAVPKPTSIGVFPVADKYIVDRNGVLWVSFIDGLTYAPLSVRFTTDNGVTWKKVNLDSVGVSFFSAIQDTVFAVTYIDGVFPFTTSSVVDIRKSKSQIATTFSLEQNYPNPFNPSTIIRYQLPVNSFVNLQVYNILGQEIAQLVHGIQDAGEQSVTFDAHTMPSGMYFYKLSVSPISGKQTQNYLELKKMLLIK